MVLMSTATAPHLILLRFRLQPRNVKVQGVAEHGETHFAIGRIGGQKPLAEAGIFPFLDVLTALFYPDMLDDLRLHVRDSVVPYSAIKTEACNK